jgi:hypothetical protein
MTHLRDQFQDFHLRLKVKKNIDPNAVLVHRIIEAYGVLKMQVSAFLTWNLEGVEWSASCPSSNFTSEKGPRVHWIGGWVGPRTDMDSVENISATVRLRHLQLQHLK